jgi:hypothetical protein
MMHMMNLMFASVVHTVVPERGLYRRGIVYFQVPGRWLKASPGDKVRIFHEVVLLSTLVSNLKNDSGEDLVDAECSYDHIIPASAPETFEPLVASKGIIIPE